MILIPDSNGEALVEFNPCHGPNDGRFCATAVTRVGLTSYKSKGVPGVRVVLGADMRNFRTALQAISTVSHVSVTPGTGVYKAGWEPTWIIGYKGNGEARRLVAATAKRHDQESVLLMHRGSRDPVVELHFEGSVAHVVRKDISDVLREAGVGGWTWGKRGRNTVLRSASVPDFGETSEGHLLKMANVRALLTAKGHVYKTRMKRVETEVLFRDSGDYDAVMGGQ